MFGPMPAGLGIDVVETQALARLIASGGDSFVDRVWTSREQNDAQGSVERLAARWAAKEAVMKALRRGLGDLEPCDIEILTEDDGSPRVVLHGHAQKAASERGLEGWSISMCHEEGWAVSIVIVNSGPDRTSTALKA